MWMNVKPFLASVREVTASTQSVLMSANALQDTSRVRPATDVKVRLQTSICTASPGCLALGSQVCSENTRAFKNLRMIIL